MSSLNDLIDNWRQKTSASDTLRAEDLDELEQHLRESVDELKNFGLSDDEAVLIASRRLGDVDEIEAEFSKIDVARSWRRRVCWMMLGFVAFQVFTAVVTIVGSGAHVMAAAFGANGIVLGSVLATAHIVAWAAILCSMTNAERLLRSKRFVRYLMQPLYSVAILWVALFVGAKFMVAWAYNALGIASGVRYDEDTLLLMSMTHLIITILLPVVCLWMIRRSGDGRQEYRNC